MQPINFTFQRFLNPMKSSMLLKEAWVCKYGQINNVFLPKTPIEMQYHHILQGFLGKYRQLANGHNDATKQLTRFTIEFQLLILAFMTTTDYLFLFPNIFFSIDNLHFISSCWTLIKVDFFNQHFPIYSKMNLPFR